MRRWKRQKVAEQLIAMGFLPQKCRSAAYAAGGNMHTAIDIICSGAFAAGLVCAV